MSWQNYQGPDNLFIFKTNIESKQYIKTIHQIFSAHQSINDWWVDTDDIDSVMRVEVRHKISEIEVISLLENKGFDCSILEH